MGGSIQVPRSNSTARRVGATDVVVSPRENLALATYPTTDPMELVRLDGQRVLGSLGARKAWAAWGDRQVEQLGAEAKSPHLLGPSQFGK